MTATSARAPAANRARTDRAVSGFTNTFKAPLEASTGSVTILPGYRVAGWLPSMTALVWPKRPVFQAKSRLLPKWQPLVSRLFSTTRAVVLGAERRGARCAPLGWTVMGAA